MPWKESRVVDERVKFVAEVLKGERKISELCQQYGISRKTGYKWIERYEEAGPAGLEDLGRRPQSCAHATPDAIVKEVLELRYKHPTWGARKLRARLEQTIGANSSPIAKHGSGVAYRSVMTLALKAAISNIPPMPIVDSENPVASTNKPADRLPAKLNIP
jgi:transposase